MKKKKDIVVYSLISFLFVSILSLMLTKANFNNLKGDINGIGTNDTFADALREVADAYINKSNKTSAGGITEGGHGGLIQYDTYLKKYNFTPEDAQKDNILFTVCTNAIYQIYKEAFGVSLPYDTDELVEYAKYRSYNNGEYNNHSNEVKYASAPKNTNYNRMLDLESKEERTTEEQAELDNLKSQEETLFNNLVTYDNYGLSYPKTIRDTFINNGWANQSGKLIVDTPEVKNELYNLFVDKYAPEENGQKDLKVGDLIVFRYVNNANLLDVSYNGNTKTISYPEQEAGHVMMVYSIELVNGYKDITLVEADNSSATTLASDKNLSNVSFITSHNLNKSFNPLENYIFKTSNFYSRIYHFIDNQNPGNSYLTRIAVIRPLEGNESQSIESGGSLRVLNVGNEFMNGKTVTPSTLTRLKYKGLSISKESKVDEENTEVVMPGDVITYTLTFENNSNTAYTLPSIIENYDTSLVRIDTDSLAKIKNDGIATRAAASAGVITIEGVTVPANGSISFEYKVTVKDKMTARTGSKIVSTGIVGSITNATITKTVGYRLSNERKQILLNAINSVQISDEVQDPSNSRNIGLKYIDDVLLAYYNTRKIITSEDPTYSSILFNDNEYSNKYLIGHSTKSILTYNENNKKTELNNQSYLNALNKYSFTDYNNLYNYYHASAVISNMYPTEKKWYGSDYCTSNCLNINEYWLNATTEWDERKVNYPTIYDINDGDVIWVVDSNKKNYIFLYLDGKIYSGYNNTMTITNGSQVRNVSNITSFTSTNDEIAYSYTAAGGGNVYFDLPRFLSNLETYDAYAIFRPMNFFGILDQELVIDEYNITYNLDGGSANNPSTYSPDSSLTIEEPTKTGYTFIGWTGTGLSEPTTDLVIPSGSIGNREYTANYITNQYTVQVEVVNGTGNTSRNVNYNTQATFTVTPNTGYNNGNISCTNNQTASLSGNTLTTGNITDNTVCTVTYVSDTEPSIVIIDTINLSILNDLLYIKLPTGTTKMTKQNFLSKITTTGEWKLYNKSNNEITSNTATLTTGSSIRSGNKEYKIVLLGDVNQNGEVEIVDMYQIYLLFKNKITSLTNIQKAAADYDKNNQINLVDLFNVYKKMKEK